MWIAGFLAITGVLYGSLTSAFQRAIGGDLKGVPLDQIPDSILYGGNILSGILIVVAVHGGITLVSWMMAKAIGGPGLLIGVYRMTAYLLPFGWLALPQIAFTVAAAGRETPELPLEWAYLSLAGLGLALFLAGLYQIYLLLQEKGPTRSAIAVVLFALFCSSILLIL